MNKAELRMNYTRRDVGKIALAALPMGRLLAAPNSNFGGVQIGIIAPYAFRRTANSAEDILKKMVELGIGAVEIEDSAVESFAGAPGGGRRRAPRSMYLYCPVLASPSTLIGSPGLKIIEFSAATSLPSMVNLDPEILAPVTSSKHTLVPRTPSLLVNPLIVLDIPLGTTASRARNRRSCCRRCRGRRSCRCPSPAPRPGQRRPAC